MEVLVCGVTALVYVATLSFGFVYDDTPQILKNPVIHGWRFVPQYFTSHVWAAIYSNTSGNYYRPLFLLWLRVNYALFGAKAAGWHLTSVACHVLATWLVFRLAERLSGDRRTAFVAALIFGVHPAHIENVAWISGVTDPLMACFVLGSFSAFVGFRRSGGVGRVAFSLVLFALGLLSKETVIVLPGLICAYVLIVGRDEELWSGSESGRGARSTAGEAPALRSLPLRSLSLPSWVLLSGFAGVALIYIVARLYALGGWSHSTVAIGWKQVLLTWPVVLWFYARHLILPVRLSEFYSLDYVAHGTATAVLLPLACVLVAAIAVVVALLFMRERAEKRLARFALVLIVVPLLPVLDLRSLTAGDIVHDRYLYLPSVGFALLMALLIREFARRLRPSGAEAQDYSPRPGGTTKVVPFPSRDNTAVAVAAAIGLGFAWLTIAQQMQWATDILLYTRGLESAPANLTVRDNLANALLDANQPARAIPLYLEVLSRNPAFWRSNYNLGVAYYKIGNYQGAEDYLQRAINIDPSDSDQYIDLALAQLQLKKLPEAAENSHRALARSAHALGYHFALGLIEEAAGDTERAGAEFRNEIAEHPENAAAAAELQKLKGASSAP